MIVPLFVNGLMIRALQLTILIIIMASPSSLVNAESGLPVPRFVSLKDDKVFARAGPGDQYPINWVYLRHSFPVEIIDEYDNWRLVRDVDKVEGWIHSVMLSGRRFAIVIMKEGEAIPVELHRKPDELSTVIARLEVGVYGKLLDCTDDWCRIQFSPYKGWVKRNHIWGVYENERFHK